MKTYRNIGIIIILILNDKILLKAAFYNIEIWTRYNYNSYISVGFHTLKLILQIYIYIFFKQSIFAILRKFVN